MRLVALNLIFASVFFVAFTLLAATAVSVDSVFRLKALTLLSSVLKSSFSFSFSGSGGASPGLRGTGFMSLPFCAAKSRHALVFALLASPAALHASPAAAISSRLKSAVDVNGSVCLLKALKASSASTTRVENSLKSRSAFSALSFNCRSSSALRSSSFFFASSNCFIFSSAWATAASHSSLIWSLMEAQFSSSLSMISFSSILSESMVSRFAERNLCAILRMADAARVSSRL
mmetsp:Transcript_49176/g.137754  ORF Transcript_49176/g.137754 Transcript_49176/m.137754 type:complete len:233 (-) Transcript_49176:125-823(-)